MLEEIEEENETSVEIEVTCECESRYRDKIEELEEVKGALEAKCEAMMNKMQKLADMVHKLKTAYDEEKLRCQELEEKLAELQNQLEQQEDGQKQKENNEASNNELLDELEDLKQNKKWLEDELRQKESDEKSLRSEIEGLTKLLNEQKKGSDDVEKSAAGMKQDLASLRKEKELLFENFAKVTEENKSLRSEIYSLQKDVQESHKKMVRAEENLQNHKENINFKTERFNHPLQHKENFSPEKPESGHAYHKPAPSDCSTQSANSLMDPLCQSRDSLPLKPVSISSSNREDHMTQANKARSNKLKNMTSNIFVMPEEQDNRARSRTPQPGGEKFEGQSVLTKPEAEVPYGERKCSRRNQPQLDQSTSPVPQTAERFIVPDDPSQVEQLLSRTSKDRDAVRANNQAR
jgi:chromosome segregation ATPase